MRSRQFYAIVLILWGALPLNAQDTPLASAKFSAQDFEISYAATLKDPPATASQIQRLFAEAGVVNEEKYRKFKRMRNAGIGLTAGGVALLTTGILLIRKADEDNDTIDPEVSEGEQVVGGALCVVTGVLCTAGGITLGAIGGAKMKKYGANLSLKSTRTGLGLVYNF